MVLSFYGVIVAELCPATKLLIKHLVMQKYL